ncbi:squalene epoxidase [Bombardia bombarda]|uniref:Squalene monooxygenase n=1 Tax=Bombardia bombarda TaxID=252184 RepID=A0AA39XPZ4_9PEZI|nr:squalene epoxidase [Bombardia bombarda]
MTLEDFTSRALAARRRNEAHEADVVVVGAGIFGCAVAFALANQGRSVILLERWMHEPDRIVGELLQPGGVDALRKLGLEACLEGIDAIPCYGYHVKYHSEEVQIPYPVVDAAGKVQVSSSSTNGQANGTETEKLLSGGSSQGQRPEGRAFHHGRFIMQLRKACSGHPNITIYETTVTDTVRGSHGDQRILGVEARTTVDKTTNEKRADFFFGQLTIIADGYDSKFRKQLLRGRAPVVRSKFYALELVDCPFPPEGYGHVVIGDGTLVLLYQIGTHETRALIDVPLDLPAASPQNGGVRGYIEKVILPSLPAGVRPSVAAALAANGGKIPKSMPNSWLPPAKQGGKLHPGVLVLGDAYNMRHPLTGGGMTVAFNDVVLLAGLLHPDSVPSLADGKIIAKVMDEFHWRRKSLTSIINVLAQALYSLFSARDRQLKALQLGCFDYFRRGYTDEPVGMLGGLISRPAVLAYHFFSVAFLAIWLNGVAVCGGSVLGLWKLPVAVVDAVLILWRACVVFLPVLWTEMR